VKKSLSTITLMFLLSSALHAQTAPPSTPAATPAPVAAIEQWATFELSLPGPSTGNPFTDVQLSATFTHGTTSLTVAGFYDGEGTYRIRFMPPQQGAWSYKTASNVPALANHAGSFSAIPPTGNNHGPVHTARTFHFDYADNTPYFEIGTTCYNWAHETDDRQQATLATLQSAPFNKIRMSILPTSFPAPSNLYPYATLPGPPLAPATAPATAPSAQGRGRGRGAGGPRAPINMPAWDYTRFNPAFFQHLEQHIAQLRDLNIQADLIFYTPYEYTTGFNGATRRGVGLDHAGDLRYLQYCVARFAAYRNVWWSLANEYDLMAKNTPGKAGDDTWDTLCQTVASADPYHHLTSIHFSQRIYSGNSKPWITHISIQNGSATEDFGRALLYRDPYYKPIVFDEMNYEGNGAARWGQLTGQQMTDQFWHTYIDGTYAGHGDVLTGWSGGGGALKGESPPRLAFLKKIMDEGPPTGIDPVDKWRDTHIAGNAPSYYLVYFGKETPTEWPFHLPYRQGLQVGQHFSVDILDTWNMTVTPVQQNFITAAGPTRYTLVDHSNARIPLPGKPYIALRIRATAPAPTTLPANAPPPPADGE
jgi:hypothetical protein